MKNNKTKSTLKENAFRSLIRQEIKKIYEAEKGQEGEVEPKEEPEEKGDFAEEATRDFVRKLKGLEGSMDSEAVTNVLTNIINSLMTTSEEKLNVLKAVKQNTVR